MAWTMAALATTACTSAPPSQDTTLHGTAIRYTLHGKQAPTIVLQAGLGDGQSTWRDVTSRMTGSQRYLSYDRPGHGGSGDAASPRNPCTIATELHDLLRQANVPPPYVLVGHSVGGLYQYAYARLYPDEVAGLVLIDPTHPAHWTTMQAKAPVAAATLTALRHTVFDGVSRLEFDQQQDCLADLPPLTKPVPARLLFSTSFQLNERGAFEAMVRDLRADWRRLLPGAIATEVPRAGHNVHHDQPEAVLDAILRMHQDAQGPISSAEPRPR